ncbi:hypothetical protein PR048_016576 [Dryococelus australis]|uniref:Reverse transcriptase RNase H-like domain-containing protein n=1 Tax=Dryococelus australis TaxID=614101 RepID=A0ABQ9HK59_9NEOP|nr:hypothetical protein PR048_016576 [Dryococelus australis]
MLTFPDFNKHFVLQVDVFSVALGTVLLQDQVEALACAWGVEKFNMYLEHHEFDLLSDNQALTWLYTHSSKIGRWIAWLKGRFRFKITQLRIEGIVGMEDQAEHMEEHCIIVKSIPESFTDNTDWQVGDDECQNIIVNLGTSPNKNYRMEKGILKNGKIIIVPEKAHKIIVKYFYDSVVGRHMGITKTEAQIERNFLAQHEKKQPHNSQIGMHSAEIPVHPWEEVFVDMHGPLPRSQYLSICTARYLGPVKKILVERIWKMFGGTEHLVSVQRDLFNGMCFEWGIKHITTSLYYPRPNFVERVNKNVKVALSICHNHNHPSWEENIAELYLAFNSVQHSTTGFSPTSLHILNKRIKNNALYPHPTYTERNTCFHRRNKAVDYSVTDASIPRLNPNSATTKKAESECENNGSVHRNRGLALIEVCTNQYLGFYLPKLDMSTMEDQKRATRTSQKKTAESHKQLLSHNLPQACIKLALKACIKLALSLFLQARYYIPFLIILLACTKHVTGLPLQASCRLATSCLLQACHCKRTASLICGD